MSVSVGSTRMVAPSALFRYNFGAGFDWPHYKVWSNLPKDETPSANQYNGGGYADFYCYRLAETYLLRAEAKYYLGDATAVDDVNAVRKRAKCQQLYTTVDIDDIVDERCP